MNAIPNIGQTELWVIDTTLKQRYGEKIDTQVVDTEVRLAVSDRALTPCEAIYWGRGNCHRRCQ